MNATWTDVAIAAMSLAFLILAALLRWQIKNARHQMHVEDKIDQALVDISKLVNDKDRVHVAIYEQMKVDRDATDKRLRYIEEFWMSMGRKIIGRFPDE